MRAYDIYLIGLGTKLAFELTKKGINKVKEHREKNRDLSDRFDGRIVECNYTIEMA